MPYEFSGLYLFGTPLPVIDEENVVRPAETMALQRAVALMREPEVSARPEEAATRQARTES